MGHSLPGCNLNLHRNQDVKKANHPMMRTIDEVAMYGSVPWCIKKRRGRISASIRNHRRCDCDMSKADMCILFLLHAVIESVSACQATNSFIKPVRTRRCGGVVARQSFLGIRGPERLGQPPDLRRRFAAHRPSSISNIKGTQFTGGDKGYRVLASASLTAPGFQRCAGRVTVLQTWKAWV
ncbi:hypothetical protein D6D10_00734 [Aureobasidium pullulans]|uniref:Uncharacterized protein n=1 Tax=Aureobasidium pullulans TaxID=5580 RepID=A0A4S8ZHJ0_AURPU|nr:hypothetical protein D6D20_02192 [Aureobasidium pullulans]THX43936.1 hypothetical protein D6D10_00734 [Aureobasidium pullulans]THZ97001.1 hypothetical protein D6C82_06695 [Aureobasidium pullulans]